MGVANSSKTVVTETTLVNEAPENQPVKASDQPIQAPDQSQQALDQSLQASDQLPQASAQDPQTTDHSNDSINEEKVEEKVDEEEEGECGFCLFMKGGGCKDSFIAWENCIEEVEKDNGDIVEKCFEVTAALKKCMDAHADYYEPILKAEKAAEAEVAKELEREKEASSENRSVEKEASSENRSVEKEATIAVEQHIEPAELEKDAA